MPSPFYPDRFYPYSSFGSSSISAIDLVQKLGGNVVGFAAVVELGFLSGVEAIKKAHPEVEVMALIRFDE